MFFLRSFIVLVIFSLTLGCNNRRLYSNGAIPELPDDARVLLVTQDAPAQRFVLPVSQAFKLIGMQPHIDGTVMRALSGPPQTVRSFDTTFQSATQLPYTTTLYPTPPTELTALIASQGTAGVEISLVDSKTGQLLFNLSKGWTPRRRLPAFQDELVKELRLAQGRARATQQASR